MKQIKSKTYKSSVHAIGKGEAIIFRRHVYDSEKEIVDVHSKAWSLAYADIKPGTLYIAIGEKWVELKGRILIYISPFSILRWKVKKGSLKWMYFLSLNNIELSNKLNSKIIFHTDEKVLPLFKSSQSIMDYVIKTKGYEIKTESKEDVVSSFKKKIDQRFTQSENIKDLLKKNFSYSYISREFKKRYDMSPVEYRNHLRLMQTSYELMFNKESILETSSKNGIHDAKFFYQKFNHLLRTNPSSFKS